MMTTALHLLGPPHVLRDGRPATTDTRKALALAAYLAVTRDYHSRETLAALLWPEMDDERARAALRRTLSAARSLLGDEAIAADRETVALAPAAGLWVDVWALEDALATVDHHHRSGEAICDTCLAQLDHAVGHYRGDFMQGFSLRDSVEFDDWQAAQAERWRRKLAAALATLVEGDTARGDLAAAVGHAQRWLELDPLREDAHRRLMQLYAWNGDRDLALRQYRDAVRVLDAELGVEPLPETTDLYNAIQEGRLSALSARTVHSPLPPSPQPPTSGPHALPLIGREEAWAELAAAYAAVGGSESREPAAGQVAIVSGEAGIGKSRLVEAFVAQAEQGGAVTATGVWHEGESILAYAPFAAALRALAADPARRARLAELPPLWLSEAGRLAPEVGALTGQEALPADVSGPGAQTRFFAAVSEVLCALLSGDVPGILFLDDAQWADDASLNLLAYLARRLRELPLLLIVAWTDEAISGDHSLRRLLAETQRAGSGREIHLARWTPNDIHELLAVADPSGQLPPNTAGRLYRETEGLPYFAVEYLAALISGRSDDWSIPPGVRDLLAARLAGVDETGRQLLQTAAVIGRSFDYANLWAASGRSEEEVVAGLERLLDSGFICEAPGSAAQQVRYDFSHQQLRSVVYDGIHLARRRLLHRRVAEALANAGNPTGEDAGQIAGHYQLAGQEAQAAAAYRAAGAYAQSLYAHREALSHYQSALALGHPDTAELQEASGDLHTLLGQYAAALHAYESAAAQAGEDSLARLEHKLGQVYERRGDWELAGSSLNAALTAAVDQPMLQARISVDLSRVTYRAGDADGAGALAQQALRQAEADGDRLAQALAHNALGILARQQEDLRAAEAHLAQSLELAEAIDSATARVAALNNLARVQAATGDTDAALGLLDQALALGRQQGDRHHEAALLNHRADVLHQAGREEEAMASLKAAVAIYAEIGVEAGGWQPEIWKLTEW